MKRMASFIVLLTSPKVTAEAMVTVVIKTVTKVTRAIKVNKVIKETKVIIKETKAMAKTVLKAMAKVKEVGTAR